MKIPKCMSTQHPDNVTIPFFATNFELGGEDEVQEAYYAFSHLGCDEQMWDCEGKEVDSFVVRKLLTKYETFFRERRLGRDLFLTLRVPNPLFEKAEAKALVEALDGIPRSFDATGLFYGDDLPPIFEVILPMTTSARSLNHLYEYYRLFVAGKQYQHLGEGSDITVAEWVGEFKPERINVIPLIEDMEHMPDAHRIVGDYLKGKKLTYQRVFLARSDPALNYGLVSAVLLNKIALQRLYRLSQEIGVKIYPIVGVGAAPFRGNLRPPSVERVLQEYPSVHTFTVQSAFKYDYPTEEVRMAIEKLKRREATAPQEVDEEGALELIRRYAAEYQKQVTALVSLINSVAKYVPSRRKRKLHIGLFGYPRNFGGVKLPRAIGFTASLYSIGLPPELLGLNALTPEDRGFLKEIYVNFEEDLRDALRYFNPRSLSLLRNRLTPSFHGVACSHLGLEPDDVDEEHREMTDYTIEKLREGENESITEPLLRAAYRRRFLG
ncbi:MAG: phosphoenolpyruvate carboxylase [Chloroflexi bacterium]|nr:phosphoenolpyruvate carboxylase [Chloroflexota bacterium]